MLTDSRQQPVVVFDSATRHRGDQMLATNDDWSGTPEYTTACAATGAFPYPPGSKDAALASSLGPGLHSLQLTSGDAQPAVALAELYDSGLSRTLHSPRLVIVSARTKAGTGDKVLVAGFVVAGDTPCTVHVRGVGPSLTAFGVNGALSIQILRYGPTER